MGFDPNQFSVRYREQIAQGQSLAEEVKPSQDHVAAAINLTERLNTDESKLNKLEKAWLRELRLTHPELNIGIQSITLKLADDCRYTPDFWTIDANGQLYFWETKGGFFRDDAKVKIKVAARTYRWARFVLVTRAKRGGPFIETPVNP